MYGPTPLPVTGRPNARTHAKILEACKTPEDVFYGFKWKYSIFEGLSGGRQSGPDYGNGSARPTTERG